jgi:hypothetical protein
MNDFNLFLIEMKKCHEEYWAANIGRMGFTEYVRIYLERERMINQK